MTSRRGFLKYGGCAAVMALAPASLRAGFEISLTDAEWRKRLSPARYAVLRKEETERPFSNSLLGEKSPLLKEARAGTYHCAGCDLAVYPSDTKFDSGTGWPSFFAPIAGAVSTRQDRSLFRTRTEVHCRRCGGHFGHVFDDGPAPTGKRHCLNGLALTFTPAV